MKRGEDGAAADSRKVSAPSQHGYRKRVVRRIDEDLQAQEPAASLLIVILSVWESALTVYVIFLTSPYQVRDLGNPSWFAPAQHIYEVKDEGTQLCIRKCAHFTTETSNRLVDALDAAPWGMRD
ncbi:unnamed protein product [Gongylonema pulchrum]|uniref:Uncharacterized protein n=1 Tax=Gongylonema pulchrum TaxID=637853 RepID=A0A183EG98_9BILA|nr:unnamed protein product [Gongylonema pulchrum]